MRIAWRVLLCLFLALPSLGADRPKASREITEDAVRQYLGDHPEVIGEMVHQYLIDHPEVVVEAMRRYQVREDKKRAQLASDAIATSTAELYQDQATPAVGGGASTAVDVVEFFDYRCPYCKRVDPAIRKLVEDNPNVRVIFKELPILGPESLLAAKASVASYRQGAYLKFHEALMAESGSLTQDALSGIAARLGLDMQKFTADMESPAVAALIERTQKLASALQIEATPTFIIGGELVKGALDADDLRSRVAKAQTRP